MPRGIYSRSNERTNIYNPNCECCILRRKQMRLKSAKHQKRVVEARVKKNEVKEISDAELERRLDLYLKRIKT